MKQLTHKEVCARGGKKRWQGISKEDRFAIMSAHWKKVKKAQKELSTASQKKALQQD